MGRVLIIDDSKTIREIIKEGLSDIGLEFTEAEDAYIGLDKIFSFRPNVIILDLNLPGKSGTQLCKELKSDVKTQNIYIIMLTASTAEEHESFGFQSGADDYICKPFDIERLLVRVERGVNENISREDALLDPLTKLYNRRFYNIFILQETSRVKRYNRDLSAMLLDIDHFKSINDNYGHNEGDEVLKKISNLIKINSRVSDIPVRWGGEEILVLLPETGLNSAIGKAEELRELIEQSKFIPDKKITVSIGVSEYKPYGGDIIDEADKALYRAKESGRNRVEFN